MRKMSGKPEGAHMEQRPAAKGLKGGLFERHKYKKRKERGCKCEHRKARIDSDIDRCTGCDRISAYDKLYYRLDVVQGDGLHERFFNKTHDTAEGRCACVRYSFVADDYLYEHAQKKLLQEDRFARDNECKKVELYNGRDIRGVCGRRVGIFCQRTVV